ncbi:MAG: succinylglutamate desuccinylase/aspartoacylase family protein [Candidatus Marinimicrobia bacterium]|nr:succinylglutamate desuccinylase/aspartoacylase family protein [Candidatus Neomarinimicrobiota bacterium]MCF7828444.1 succinylglutamate desuccinylase/aspartoacylase family protein [Candidatus Neomarinimicrobiota bacterium]MCF7880962.1 succinylglutamate desuccinylase/aspartoacylase family protein [Candidatus Neomarinimicrobiota bacterium]
MSNDILKIGDSDIAPGERKTINLPVARLYTNNWTHMPVTVVRGKTPGPQLFVCAAQHGDEINGVEIIRRLLKSKRLKSLKGTLIAVPIVNVFGFIHSSRYLPDRRDLNRSYPGSKSGSLASRLAHIFIEEIASNATHGIDIHTAAVHRYNLPQVRANLKDEETLAMAKAFGTPVIIHSRQRNNSLRATLAEMEKPIIVYEAGEALRLNESVIKFGVKGIIRVMRHLGMLRKSKSKPTESVRTDKTQWVRAKQSGLIHLRVKAGNRVKRHDTLAVITDPLGNTSVELKAPYEGVVIGHTNLPLVNAGDAAVHVAKLKVSPEIEEELELLEE